MQGPGGGAIRSAGANDARGSVVKIFNAQQSPGWIVPWQAGSVDSSTGSGAVISLEEGTTDQGPSLGVLTAAHVVADSRFLQVQRSSDRFSGEKFPAHVVAICHEADLALIATDDPGALVGVTPLEIAPGNQLPCISDKVRVVGYPVGGATCSVTEGTVSRVEVQEYSHSMRSGLALTVDAAINSGNSGGPLIDAATTHIVGVAIQKMVGRGVELQGHAVPAPLVRRFLAEAATAARGGRPGEPTQPHRMRLPSLACALQSLEAPALRRKLGLEKPLTGVLISRLHNEESTLRVGDVLLAFAGHRLDNLGFCEVLGQRLHFAAARDLHAVGERVELEVWRDGRKMTIDYQLQATQHLVARGQYDCVPPFFVCGGLVFQPLSAEYLYGFNGQGRPSHLQDLFSRGCVTPERSEVVIISQILADEINHGYGSGYIGAPIVKTVNGQPIRDLAHLVRAVREARLGAADGFLEFLADGGRGPFQIVLPLAGLDEAEGRISRLYQVPACSVHFEEGEADTSALGLGSAPASKL